MLRVDAADNAAIIYVLYFLDFSPPLGKIPPPNTPGR